MPNEENKPKTSLAYSMAIGPVAGFCEIMVNHPLWVLKTRRQNQYPFTLNPFILYKGIVPHALCEVLLTTLQIAPSIQLDEYFNSPGGPKKNPLFSSFATLAGPFLGGGLCGLISNPIELIMTQQQKNAKSEDSPLANRFSKIGARIIQNNGIRRLGIGMPCMALREGIYTTSLFLGTSRFGKKLNNYVQNPMASSFLAGAASGLITSIATHPIDTVKTLQHDSVISKFPLTAYQAAKDIYKTGGYLSFYRGLLERSARVVSATAIVGMVMEKMRPTY